MGEGGGSVRRRLRRTPSSLPSLPPTSSAEANRSVGVPGQARERQWLHREEGRGGGGHTEGGSSGVFSAAVGVSRHFRPHRLDRPAVLSSHQHRSLLPYPLTCISPFQYPPPLSRRCGAWSLFNSAITGLRLFRIDRGGATEAELSMLCRVHITSSRASALYTVTTVSGTLTGQRSAECLTAHCDRS